jgi:catechol 2,3-dioxygenase
MMNEQYYLPENVFVGHVHLIVTNLERSLAFYRDVLGFHISEDLRMEPNARDVVFLTANDADHHHVALMEMSQFQPYPSGGHTGLFHIAFLYPSRYDLALALKNILEQGYPIDHCHDYATGEAVNLRDPDGIPLELYYSLPSETWPRVDGQIRVINRKIEAKDILQVLQEQYHLG